MATQSAAKVHYERLLSPEAKLIVFERSEAEFPFYRHSHPEYELTLILEGSGQRFVGDHIAEYAPGDLVLVGPNLAHSWRSCGVGARPQRNRAIVVQFRRDFLGEEFFDTPGMKEIACLLTRAAGGLSFGRTRTGMAVASVLADLHRLPAARQLVTVLSVLLDLAGERNAELLCLTRIPPMCRIENQSRIDAICEYLDGHFDDEIDFALLAREFRMGQASLCRLFKRATGRTMTAYLNEVRVRAAAELLADTDDSVLEIGFRVGFGNYSNFNRQFKKIKGDGPRQFRGRFPGNTGTEPAAPSISPA